MRTDGIFPILSISVLIFGILISTYSYFIFPTLIASYGGGEQIQLDVQNNYEQSFNFEPKYRLTVTIDTDNPVTISINNIINITTIYYKVVLNISEYYLVIIKGTTLTEGFMKLRQEIPLSLQLFSLGLLLSGIVVVIISFYHQIGNKSS